MLDCSEQNSTSQKSDLEDAWSILPAMALDRWKRFAQRIVKASRSVDELGDSGIPDAWLQ